MDEYIYKDKKMLRCGYTTGTCAALAAKAAATFLVTGLWIPEAEIMTPKGRPVKAAILERRDGGGFAECAVRKDAGDDYDVTDGLLIFARAEFLSGAEPGKTEVLIDGGAGVGRVTKPGLNQPVGAAAINSVPRQMIRETVCEVLEECEMTGRIKITVSVPSGEEAAKKTFNPVLGITGGISILGTSGIVEPMSEEALVETIRAHMQVLRAEKRVFMAAVPGNMGAGFLARYLAESYTESRYAKGSCVEKEYPEIMKRLPMVTCSNFIGKTIDMAAELGFSGLVIAGHLGKLVKLGNGIMNTHSKEGDGRMDTMVSCALTAGADLESLRSVQGSNTTEEAMESLKQAGLLEETVRILCSRIDTYVKRRASESLKTGVILFDAEARILGTTDGALDILDLAAAENFIVEKGKGNGYGNDRL